MIPVSYVEKEILDAVKNLREPSITQLKRNCGLSIFTVKSVCKKLMDRGLLKDVQGYRYRLTDEGSHYLLGWAKPMSFDENAIKNIAAQVAEQISKQIKGKRFMAGEEGEIKIKTEFTPEIEDETGSLYSNIDKLGTKYEKEEAQKIEEAVKLLKRIKGRR